MWQGQLPRGTPKWARRWRELAAGLFRVYLDLQVTLAMLTRVLRTPTTRELALRLLPSVVSAGGEVFHSRPVSHAHGMLVPEERCNHPATSISRYGNSYGRFSKCRMCGRRWRWADGAPGQPGRWLVSPQHSLPWGQSSPPVSALAALPTPTAADTRQEPPRPRKGKGRGGRSQAAFPTTTTSTAATTAASSRSRPEPPRPPPPGEAPESIDLTIGDEEMYQEEPEVDDDGQVIVVWGDSDEEPLEQEWDRGLTGLARG